MIDINNASEKLNELHTINSKRRELIEDLRNSLYWILTSLIDGPYPFQALQVWVRQDEVSGEKFLYGGVQILWKDEWNDPEDVECESKDELLESCRVAQVILDRTVQFECELQVTQTTTLEEFLDLLPYEWQ